MVWMAEEGLQVGVTVCLLLSETVRMWASQGSQELKRTEVLSVRSAVLEMKTDMILAMLR
jgi:hypothetical protein